MDAAQLRDGEVEILTAFRPESAAASFAASFLTFYLSAFFFPRLPPLSFSLPVYPSFPFLPLSLPPSLLSAMQMCFLWFCHQRLISTLLGVLFIPPAERDGGGGGKKEGERNEERRVSETDTPRQKLSQGKDKCSQIHGKIEEKRKRTREGGRERMGKKAV